MDVPVVDPRLPQLIGSCPPQIESKRIVAEEPGRSVHVACKLIDDLGTDAVTARSNARPHGRNEISGVGPVSAPERTDRCCRCASRHASPSRVNGRHRTRDGIGDQKRHAVGDMHSQTHCRVMAHRHVRFGSLVGNMYERFTGYLDDPRAMHLSQALQVSWRHTERRGDLSPRDGRFVGRTCQFECASREEMRGAKRSTAERRPPRLLRPQEVAARLWKVHMHIIGIGLDATEIDRLEQTIRRFGDRFLNRIFTAAEIAYARRRRNPAPHFAARFAAKEAAMKALGTGHSRGVRWRDIEVVRFGGPPQLRFYGGAARRFEAMRATGSLLTITHSETLALAHVLLLGSGPEQP